MAYRDEHQRCPRCGVDLIDAVVGVACATCRGIWLSPASVTEMVIQMQVPPDFVTTLPLRDDPRRDELLCPTCRKAMQTRSLFAVPIDVCEKHGIWFDANELASVLMRSVRTSTS